MSSYLEAGWIPFENIIYTYEADMRNPKRLAYLIESILI